MENKYYTPDIEEFHVGFEFEGHPALKSSSTKEWQKYTLGLGLGEQWKIIEDNISDKKVRVKFLDREDIESLGFEIPQGGLDYIYKKSINTVDYFLITNSDYPNKIEIRCSNPSWAFGSFLGTIKNKSELKVLLKQLEI